jgi:hypothetical protein
MIVRRLDGRWVVIDQAEHARQAGKLAEAWCLGPVPPSLVRAATLHDIGWNAWDAEPALDPATGGPANFTAVRDVRHADFYTKGIAEVASQDAFAGYLVSLHGSGIYSGRYGWTGLQPIAWESIGERGRAFLREQAAFRASLLPRIPAELAEFESAWRCYMLLQVFDYLSLLCCLGLESAGCGPVPRSDGAWGRLQIQRLGPTSVGVSPFPFPGDALDVTVRCRELTQERFGDDQELRRALASQPAIERTTSYRAVPAA